ncbi:EAL domain-containing protein [Acidithrix sp. C25]|uniref:putative bifunctional diguanylate cyclase/phosphodiesterase n=1 Tax=Acidithrix sp. C25 TaxID=1671482 RepID=UPI001BB8F47C|nr:EAL domain-containing protein [Acidithrix sp. C25]CAG4935066.1 unnamed protein product [Acidithrix sp. C25]
MTEVPLDQSVNSIVNRFVRSVYIHLVELEGGCDEKAHPLIESELEDRLRLYGIYLDGQQLLGDFVNHEKLLDRLRSFLGNQNRIPKDRWLRAIDLHEVEFREAHLEIIRAETAYCDGLYNLFIQISRDFDSFCALSEQSLFDSLANCVTKYLDAHRVTIFVAYGTISTGFDDRVTRVASGGHECSLSSSALFDSQDLMVGAFDSIRRGDVVVQSPGWQYVDETQFLEAYDSSHPRIDSDIRQGRIYFPFRISQARTGAIAISLHANSVIPGGISPIVDALGKELDRIFQARAVMVRNRRLESAKSIRAKILFSESVNEIEIIKEATQALVQDEVVAGAAIFLRHDEDSTLRVAYGFVDPETQMILDGWTMTFGAGDELRYPLVESLITRKVVVTPGVPVAGSASMSLRPAIMANFEHSTLIRVPIVKDEYGIGVMALLAYDEEDNLVDDHLIGEFVNIQESSVTQARANLAKETSRWLAELNETLLESAGVLVSALTEEELLDPLCKALVSKGVFSTGIFLKRDRKLRTLRTVAASGIAVDEFDRLLVAFELEKKRSVLAKLAFGDSVQVCDRNHRDVDLAHWHKLLHSNGWISAVAAPVRRDGRAFGVLIVTSNQLEALSDSVVQMIKTVAMMIEHGFGEIDLKVSLNQERSRLSTLASMDFLTGIGNRAAFEYQCAIALENRKDEIIAIGILDLDGFKDLNDSFGHQAGDRYLKVLSQKILEASRSSEIVARLGGDEFGFCLRIQDVSEISSFVDRISDLIRDSTFELSVTGSFGWAFAPLDDASFDSLLAKADEALYAAKSGGGDQFKFYGGEVARSVGVRNSVREKLPDAIEKGVVSFKYQPKVQISTGDVCGLEMLLRWGSFETSVVIGELKNNPVLARSVGRYLIKRARSAREILDRQGLEAVDLSLNFSPSHFLGSDFENDLEPLSSRSRSFVIEITEDVAIEDFEEARLRISALKGSGFRISMDDFGSGFTSLSSIAKLTVDEIKIDRSFLLEADNDPNTYAVFSSLLMLGRLANARVVLEGIESRAQEELWVTLGGKFAQGYLYGRPRDLGESISIIRNQPIKPNLDVALPVEDFELIGHFLHFQHFHTNSRFLSSTDASCGLGDWFDRRFEKWGLLDEFNSANMAHGRLHIYLQDAKSNLSRAYIDELEGEVRDRIVLLARAIKAISANRTG